MSRPLALICALVLACLSVSSACFAQPVDWIHFSLETERSNPGKIQASFRSDVPLMFAALLLVSLCGIVIFLATSWLTRKVLGHWHESEMKRER